MSFWQCITDPSRDLGIEIRILERKAKLLSDTNIPLKESIECCISFLTPPWIDYMKKSNTMTQLRRKWSSYRLGHWGYCNCGLRGCPNVAYVRHCFSLLSWMYVPFKSYMVAYKFGRCDQTLELYITETYFPLWRHTKVKVLSALYGWRILFSFEKWWSCEHHYCLLIYIN